MIEFIRSTHTRVYLLEIFSVSESRVDHQQDVNEAHNDDSDINRLVLDEIGIGEDVVPVDRWWKDRETAGEGG